MRTTSSLLRTNPWRAFVLALTVACLSASSVLAQPPGVKTQSPCWTTSVTVVNHSTDSVICATGTCGNPSFQCGRCLDVTICSDKCAGLNPTSFTITSSGNNSADCHSICSPTGQFLNSGMDVGPACSWATPRTMLVANVGGIPDGQCIKFRICHVQDGFDYTIHCNGCNCGGACPDAVVHF